jgi:hypothetical protein
VVLLPSATWLGVVFVSSIAFDGIGCSAVDGVSVDVVGKVGGVDSGAGSGVGAVDSPRPCSVPAGVSAAGVATTFSSPSSSSPSSSSSSSPSPSPSPSSSSSSSPLVSSSTSCSSAYFFRDRAGLRRVGVPYRPCLL